MKPSFIFLITVLLLFPNLQLQAQFDRGDTLWAKDLIGNGARDTLFRFCESGSGFGGCDYFLKNSGNGPDLKMYVGGCFCSYMTWVVFPPEYEKPANRMHLDALLKTVSPQRRYQPDPALSWIQNSANQQLQGKFFGRAFHFGTDWQEGQFELPESYWIKMQGKGMENIYFPEGESPAGFDPSKDPAWLYFAGSGLGIPRFSLSSPPATIPEIINYSGHKLLKFPHGLAIQEKGRWAWLFLNVYSLTGGPEKLRWPSVLSVKTRGNLIFVEHSHAPDTFSEIWVIDPKLGIVASLPVMTHNEGFIFKGNDVILNQHSYGDNWMAPRAVYSLKQLQNELNKLSQP